MGSVLTKIRNDKMRAQKGLCYYCDVPMWLEELSDYCRVFGLSANRAGCFRCTAEHLRARSDGGRDTIGNVVAACRFCNLTRHRALRPLAASAYRDLVRRQLNKGRWHGFVPPRNLKMAWATSLATLSGR
jgi:hypothetical protein